MPAKRKTKQDYMAEKFTAMYRTGKALTRLRDEEIAEMLGLKSITSLWARKKDPTKFKFGEVLVLSAILQWQESDVTELFSVMK